MKFQLLLLLNLVCALHSFAQKTKLIEKKFEGSKQISEKFYVLKSDKGIKHGAYICTLQKKYGMRCEGKSVHKDIKFELE